MKQIRVLQSMSGELFPDTDKFMPDAKPGMFKVGNDLTTEVTLTVEECGVRWIKATTLYIYYAGFGLMLPLRPVTAEALGELKVGRTYRLTTVQLEHRGHRFYGIQAKDLTALRERLDRAIEATDNEEGTHL